MMKTNALKTFIKENTCLFWWIKEEKKGDISLDLLVEMILNYGDGNNIKKLFQLIGIKKAAEIFNKQKSQRRVNYHPRTLHFFDLYFQKNA